MIQMEEQHDIVIVGAGIAGLATSLGLHRMGIESLVLESADSLRTTGFALGIWTNGWKALDALGLGEVLRAQHARLTSIVVTSADSGIQKFELPFSALDSQCDHELRSVNRKVLLETVENELPRGTVRYSSKLVNIENIGFFKHVHLADGTILKTKVLLGCDGVNSVVAKYLGFSQPSFTGRTGVRGIVRYKDAHGLDPQVRVFVGKGIRYGIVPCDKHVTYWFFAYSPFPQEKEMEKDPVKTKQFVLSKLGKVSDKIKSVFEETEVNNIVCAPLRYRKPWEVLLGNISKDNICVAGDAWHPMTPDLGQGGCIALEDAVVLARILGEALKGKSSTDEDNDEEMEYQRIQKGLKKFADERKWRGFDIVSTAYIGGLMQHYGGFVVNFFLDNFPSVYPKMLLRKARYDCGKLYLS